MKHLIPPVITLFLLSILIPSTSNAQNCDSYYPFKKGIKYEITHYDKNNKVESVNKLLIKDVYTENGALTATVHTLVTTTKGKETVNADYKMKCEKNATSVDKTMLLREKLTSFKNSGTDINISGTDLIIPNKLTSGQSLPDSETNMDVSAGSVKMRMGTMLSNRKVVGEDRITTPAGTFDCVVITFDSKVKTMVAKNSKGKLWLAKGIGLVQQENYTSSGKLESKDVLTSFQK